VTLVLKSFLEWQQQRDRAALTMLSE
jgi:hypothetical protein